MRLLSLAGHEQQDLKLKETIKEESSNFDEDNKKNDEDIIEN